MLKRRKRRPWKKLWEVGWGGGVAPHSWDSLPAYQWEAGGDGAGSSGTLRQRGKQGLEL